MSRAVVWIVLIVVLGWAAYDGDPELFAAFGPLAQTVDPFMETGPAPLLHDFAALMDWLAQPESLPDIPEPLVMTAMVVYAGLLWQVGHKTYVDERTGRLVRHWTRTYFGIAVGVFVPLCAFAAFTVY